jgi:hypothetical protein
VAAQPSGSLFRQAKAARLDPPAHHWGFRSENVRFGSKAEVALSHGDVRYTPNSDHSGITAKWSLSANSGHLRFLRRSVLRRLVARVYFSATGRESSDANVPIFAAFLLLRISILL